MKQEYKDSSWKQYRGKTNAQLQKEGEKNYCTNDKKKNRWHCYEHEGYVMPDDFDVGKQK